MSENDEHTGGTSVRHDDPGMKTESADREGAAFMAADQVFEPGPSFVENDPPTDRLPDMPAWLQTFAAAAIEKGEMPSDDAAAVEPPQPTQTEQDHVAASRDAALPDWLQDSSAENRIQQTSSVETLEAFDDFEEPAGTDTFISEDDLPGWLRAFSEETGQPSSVNTQPPRVANAHPKPAGSAAAVRVPPVENIWLSTYERQALGPGPALFALLASNDGTHLGGSEESAHGGAQGYQATNVDPSSMPQTVADDAAMPDAAKQHNSTRLLLITLLVVLVLVILSAVFLG